MSYRGSGMGALAPLTVAQQPLRLRTGIICATLCVHSPNEAIPIAPMSWVGEYLRDGVNAFDIAGRRILHRLPPTLRRSYWSAGEFRRDAARLTRLGYDLESQSETPNSVTAVLPAVAGGVTGHLDQSVERAVPWIHAVYRRRL